MSRNRDDRINLAPSPTCGAILVQEEVEHAQPQYADREDAGRILTQYIDPKPDPEAQVLALPRGGIPVAAPLAAALGCPLDVYLVRKLPIPSSPEMGFGAMTLDGQMHLNQQVLRRFGISREDIDKTATQVRKELKRRAEVYRGTDDPPEVQGRTIWLVDDGLATGYTALAAINALKKQNPSRIHLCVPASPADSVRRVQSSVDAIYVLRQQLASPFAVAAFYQHFPELIDDEVLAYLR